MNMLGKQLYSKNFHLEQIKNPQWHNYIPLFDCPDDSINKVYYYRWEVVRKHLKYIETLGRYVFSEFLTKKPLYWAGPYNTIVCAADHHTNEARWLKNSRYAKDYCRFWTQTHETKANSYSSSLASIAWSVYLVNNDKEFLIDLLDDLILNHYRWMTGKVNYPDDDGFDNEMGLFWNTGRNSSGEFNLASAQLSEPLKGIQGYKIRGGAGYRPDINANMYGDLFIIAKIASLAHRDDIAEDFLQKAQTLKNEILNKLWDPNRRFFLHRWRYDEYSEADRYGFPSIKSGSFIWETNHDRFGGVGFQPEKEGIGRGRELIGYIPWYYNLPDDSDKYAKAWDYLMDPEYFFAPFGPTSAEKNDPWFSIMYDCRANGNSFPMITSRVLNAAANFLNNYEYHGSFTKADYIKLLKIFTKIHLTTGEPYIAELHHPYKNNWVVNRPIGRHYFHSSFCNLVITGLVGLRPAPDDTITINPLIPDEWDYFSLTEVPYHNHIINIIWDRTGKRYGLGKGMHLLVDNKCIHLSPKLEKISAICPKTHPKGIRINDHSPSPKASNLDNSISNI